MGTISDLKDVKNSFNDNAAKPSSIISAGVIVLLAISEWQNPTNLRGVAYKIGILIISFLVITLFNTIYFKRYWRNYSK